MHLSYSANIHWTSAGCRSGEWCLSAEDTGCEYQLLKPPGTTTRQCNTRAHTGPDDWIARDTATGCLRRFRRAAPRRFTKKRARPAGVARYGVARRGRSYHFARVTRRVHQEPRYSWRGHCRVTGTRRNGAECGVGKPDPRETRERSRGLSESTVLTQLQAAIDRIFRGFDPAAVGAVAQFTATPRFESRASNRYRERAHARRNWTYCFSPDPTIWPRPIPRVIRE